MTTIKVVFKQMDSKSYQDNNIINVTI